MILRVVRFFNGAVSFKDVMKEKSYFFNAMLELYNEEMEARNSEAEGAMSEIREKKIKETIRRLRGNNG